MKLDKDKCVVMNRIAEWQIIFYRDWSDQKLRKTEVLFKLFELQKRVVSARCDEDLNDVRRDLLSITEKYPG